MEIGALLKPDKICVIGASEKSGFGGDTCRNVIEYMREGSYYFCLLYTSSTPMKKRYGAIKHGARLVVYGPNYEDAENRAHEIEAEEGRKFVHAYESNETIAGQGTVAIESLLEKGDFDAILVPTGGGGLLCGVAIAAKAMNPDIKVYGLQTNTSAPWDKSFHEPVSYTHLPSGQARGLFRTFRYRGWTRA